LTAFEQGDKNEQDNHIQSSNPKLHRCTTQTSASPHARKTLEKYELSNMQEELWRIEHYINQKEL
jgi:hypothetical protein